VFGNIGMPEMILIMTVALIVFGPKKLPEIGRTIGKAIREFKKSTEEIKDRFEEQIKMDELKDIRNDFKDIKSNLSDISPLKGFKDGLKDIQKDLSGDEDAKKIS
jgi:sec-independent protein translocase protein TatA